MVRHRASALILAFLASACAAPGSSVGHLSLEGRLVSEAGELLPDREVQVGLPAAYGLGGLDLVLGGAEDFGNEAQTFTATTDSRGEFFLDLGNRGFHVSFWLIPPLGARPRHPPPPFLLLRVPSFPGEYYAVQTWDGEFRVLTSDGAELRPSESSLSGLAAHAESASSNAGLQSTIAVVELRFRRQE